MSEYKGKCACGVVNFRLEGEPHYLPIQGMVDFFGIYVALSLVLLVSNTLG